VGALHAVRPLWPVSWMSQRLSFFYPLVHHVLLLLGWSLLKLIEILLLNVESLTVLLGVAVILHLMLLLDAVVFSTSSWIITFHVAALLCAVESLVFVVQWMQWVENARVAISLCLSLII
jgi:hypothetical protein